MTRQPSLNPDHIAGTFEEVKQRLLEDPAFRDEWESRRLTVPLSADVHPRELLDDMLERLGQEAAVMPDADLAGLAARIGDICRAQGIDPDDVLSLTVLLVELERRKSRR